MFCSLAKAQRALPSLALMSFWPFGLVVRAHQNLKTCGHYTEVGITTLSRGKKECVDLAMCGCVHFFLASSVLSSLPLPILMQRV